MSPRRACKKDGNQDAIVNELEKVGLFVIDAHEFAQYRAGIADLLVHWGERMAYVEIKEIGEGLNDNEVEFRRLCNAHYVPYIVLDTTESASVWAQEFRRG